MAILKSKVIGKDGAEPNWKEGNRIWSNAVNEAIKIGTINLREVHEKIQKEKEDSLKGGE